MEEDRSNDYLGQKWSTLTNFRTLRIWPTGRPVGMCPGARIKAERQKNKRARSVQEERWQLYATYCPFC